MPPFFSYFHLVSFSGYIDHSGILPAKEAESFQCFFFITFSEKDRSLLLQKHAQIPFSSIFPHLHERWIYNIGIWHIYYQLHCCTLTSPATWMTIVIYLCLLKNFFQKLYFPYNKLSGFLHHNIYHIPCIFL